MLETSARRPLTPVTGVATVALALVLVLALGGCGGKAEKAVPAPEPTPIARLDTASMHVPRIEFCPLVPAKAVTAALGGKATGRAAYGNGDEEQVRGVGQDVVHELGCSWTAGSTSSANPTTGSAATGSEARAWVFASPVTPALARSVVVAARRAPGCRAVPGTGFGDPSSTQVCRLPDGRQRVRHAGLFGQTWLTCELTAPAATRATLRARTDAWCVQVVNALDTAG